MSFFRSVGLIWVIIFALTTLLSAQNEYEYSYMPKKVYTNQLFPVTVIDTTHREDHPRFKFDASSEIHPLFKEPLVVRNGNDRFYTFYFKASKSDVHIPRLFIVSDSQDISLDPQIISLVPLKSREDFCAVLAADMKIKNHQVSNYDENHHLVTFSLEAFEANLEDMKLNNVEEYGIEHLKRDHAKVEAEFYVVIPQDQKRLKFTYFNTIKKQYVFLQVPVELEDASVTTQSDLNPKEDSFDKLKKYTFMVLVLFFLIMFLYRRDFFYLVLGVVSLITLLTFYIPHKQICVKQGAPLYILPTKTSTMSTKVDQKFNTMLLGEHGEFKKVEYKKGIIGWIKNEDLCEN
ncbi:MAG: hypothetical protein P794_06100 [Epsilonproteobacteria bacterium (ex Lamellibrachia satsuma)]|nr:MAG: hypothetical protein P794_06100 [Epsilonproteobacteria bacterium (ex Lamellibrachia satsuma)]